MWKPNGVWTIGAHVAGLFEREGGALELGDHSPLPEEPEVAAACRGGGVDGVGLGELFELVGLGVELRAQLLRERLVLDQDVRGVDLGAREEALVLVVVFLDFLVGQDGRFLVVAHHTLHDEALAEVVDLADDLGIPIVSLGAALLGEQIVQDEVVDELPLAFRSGELRARARRKSFDLAAKILGGELLAGVGRDHVATGGGLDDGGRRRRGTRSR